MIRITENYRQGSQLRRTQRGWDATRTFIVSGVASKEQALVATDETDTGIAIPQVNDAHPLTAALRVFDVSAQGGPTAWTVTVNYSTPPPSQPGGFQPPNDNPLLQTPTVSIQTVYAEEEVDITPEGWAIVNPALDPLRPAPIRPVRFKLIELRRNEPFYDVPKSRYYEDAVNDDTFSIGTLTFFPGEVKLVAYELVEAVRLDAPYVPVVYKFDCKPLDYYGVSRFDLVVRNVGNTGWYDDNGTPTKGRLITKDGVPLTDVDLDRFGKPIDDSVRVESTRGTAETPIDAPDPPWYGPLQVFDGSPVAGGRPPTFSVWRNARRVPFAGLL